MSLFERVREYKASQGCQRCGERDPDRLTFHHRVPALKKANICEILAQGGKRTGKRVWAEIRKCDVLCESCHQAHHERRQEQWEQRRERLKARQKEARLWATG